jgi:hypothetical protein
VRGHTSFLVIGINGVVLEGRQVRHFYWYKWCSLRGEASQAFFTDINGVLFKERQVWHFTGINGVLFEGRQVRHFYWYKSCSLRGEASQALLLI